MKKDKDWLSEQVGDLNSTNAFFIESGEAYIDTAVSIERVYDLIYQLDEPEVLSQEWIDEHKYRYDNIEVVGIKDLQNLLVPKQELPVIPRFVAEWIEELKQDERPLYSVMSSLLNKTNHTWSVWKSANKNFSEVVAQAWLGGYEVAEEQKYVIKISEHDYMVMDDEGFMYPTDINVHKYKSEFTEQEIKDYDPRYWTFAVPVEELEE